MINFNDYKYERPNYEDIKAKVNDLIDKFIIEKDSSI